MVAEKNANRFWNRRDCKRVAIIAAAALVIGVYLIATTTLISRDGVTYINYARGLASSPLSVLRDSSDYAPRSYTPGYPFLILVGHNVAGLFCDGSTQMSWIYAAQGTTLACRILALILLYFVGKELVGGQWSFWAVLILLILPYPAKFGSDALRGWPHLAFLSGGFLFLVWAVRRGKWQMFGAVGFIAGLGYIVRPMCAQLVLYGILWLASEALRQKGGRGMSRARLAGGLAALLVGFAVVAVPYMKARGEILPHRAKQIIHTTLSRSEPVDVPVQKVSAPTEPQYAAGMSTGVAGAIKVLALLGHTIGENLLYYFVPAFLVGAYCYFRRSSKSNLRFLMAAFILTNIVMIVTRYHFGNEAMSRRYVLPLTALSIFLVPIGIHVLCTQSERVIRRIGGWKGHWRVQSRHWFVFLIIVGAGVCAPKLARPIRIEKKSHRLAAQWLQKNTTKEDVVAVFDIRVSFYAEREGRKLGNYVPWPVDYVVQKVKEGEKAPKKMTEAWSWSPRGKKKKERIVIYRRP